MKIYKSRCVCLSFRPKVWHCDRWDSRRKSGQNRGRLFSGRTTECGGQACTKAICTAYSLVRSQPCFRHQVPSAVFLQLIVPGTKDNLVNFNVDTAAVRTNYGKLRRRLEIRQRVHPLYISLLKQLRFATTTLHAILHGTRLERPRDVRAFVSLDVHCARFCFS